MFGSSGRAWTAHLRDFYMPRTDLPARRVIANLRNVYFFYKLFTEHKQIGNFTLLTLEDTVKNATVAIPFRPYPCRENDAGSGS
jgi:hypothetical protein